MAVLLRLAGLTAVLLVGSCALPGHNLTFIAEQPQTSTLAGHFGGKGYVDGQIPAASATFTGLVGVAADASGNIYALEDTGSLPDLVIRKIAASGTVTTLKVTFPAIAGVPTGFAATPDGNLFVADDSANIFHVSPQGAVSTVSFSTGGSSQIAIDGSGYLFIADFNNSCVWEIAQDGTQLNKFTGTGAEITSPVAVAVDTSDNCYVIGASTHELDKISSSGTVAVLDSTTSDFAGPAGLAVDASGVIYVSDSVGNTVVQVAAAGGFPTAWVGSGSTGSDDGTGFVGVSFNGPRAIVFDGLGNLVVADSGNNEIRRVTSAAKVTTVAGVPGVAGGTDGATQTPLFADPYGVAVDHDGNVYVAEPASNAVRKITKSGQVSTLAGPADLSSPKAVAVDAGGNVYVNDAGHGRIVKIITSTGQISPVYSGFTDETAGITVDSKNNVYVAHFDAGAVEKITSSGALSTFYPCSDPWGVAVDAHDNVYVVSINDSFLTKISPSGAAVTINNALVGPTCVAIGSDGTAYITEQTKNVVVKVSSTGVLSSWAGVSGQAGAVNGTGSVSQFRAPAGIAIDSQGSVYVADDGNYVVRKIILKKVL